MSGSVPPPLTPGLNGFDVSQTWLAGLTQPQLLQLQSSLLQAMIALTSGAKVATASYTQGDGSKSVTYQLTDQASVTQTLMLVNRALGLPSQSRRPMRIRYT
jgi:hypothetical protein